MGEYLTSTGKAILLLSAAYHLVMGGLCLVSLRWSRKSGELLYSLKIPEQLDPRYEYIWKPLGAFAVFTGAVALQAWRENTHFSVQILDFLAGMYVLRALMRWVHHRLFERAYGVPLSRSLANIVFNLVLAAVMFFFGSYGL